MEVAGFIVALVALLVSVALGLHTITIGPRLKAEAAIRHLSDGDVWHVTGVQITVYNLGGSAMPVEGVGVGTGEPRSLSYADPDALAETTGVRNPSFPLSLAPGEAVNVLLVRDLEPGKFLRVRYYKRVWGFGPLRAAVWDKPITDEMRLGPRIES